MYITTESKKYPWDNQPATTDPYPNPSTTPIPTISNWPPIPEPAVPGTEEFHDFMCWLAGFTDPDNPPTQERWEAFQQKVREMAALFFEYKKEQRAREFNHTVALTTTASAATAGAATISLGANSGGLVGNQAYTYEELSTM